VEEEEEEARKWPRATAAVATRLRGDPHPRVAAYPEPRPAPGRCPAEEAGPEPGDGRPESPADDSPADDSPADDSPADNTADDTADTIRLGLAPATSRCGANASARAVNVGLLNGAPLTERMPPASR
jgi:hypothetical protein